MQLEFFPRMELKGLSDFQRLEGQGLSILELRSLVQRPDFFRSPKPNDVICQKHSDLIDKILGVRTAFVEEMLISDALGFDPQGSHETWGPSLHQGVQTWVGLDTRTLQTPYSEILRVLQLLKIKPYQQIVDLGAAYGRMGVVIGGLYPKNLFLGYEYVKSRVEEGNRLYTDLGFAHCRLIQQDLFHPEFELIPADVYFIYDYGQVEHIDKTLKQIDKIGQTRPIKIVVRGKYTKQIIAENYAWPGLRYPGKVEELFSIYTTARSH